MTEVVCPCCAGRGRVPDVTEVGLVGLEGKIFGIVREAKHEGITISRLVDRVYADDADGGPDFASDCVRVLINRMNKKLAAVALRVKANHRGGGSGAVYRVVAL